MVGYVILENMKTVWSVDGVKTIYPYGGTNKEKIFFNKVRQSELKDYKKGGKQ